MKLNDLLNEVIDRDGPFSPVYTRVAKFTDSEKDFFENQYEMPPNYFGMKFPPAQVQWQWVEERDKGNITYGVIFVKEVEHDHPREIKMEGVPKRYKVVTVCINDSNGQTGVVRDYCRVSDTFTSMDNLDALERFLNSLEFLSDNYNPDIGKIMTDDSAITHFGSVNGYMI